MQPNYPYQPPTGSSAVSHMQHSTSADQHQHQHHHHQHQHQHNHQHQQQQQQHPVMAPTSMVNLPPLRGLETHIPPPVSPLHPNIPQHHYYPAVSAPMSSYYQQPMQMPQMLPQGYMTLPLPPVSIRYAPIPPASSSGLLGGGRPRKEIKRRTKTGCLTCRKRRIKCDEQHPVCRNCQKSKRECAGYEPIFKNQKGQQSSTPASNRSSSAGQTPSPTTQTMSPGPVKEEDNFQVQEVAPGTNYPGEAPAVNMPPANVPETSTYMTTFNRGYVGYSGPESYNSHQPSN